ncbi:MAG TPA: tail fiber domain-containing protein, partial [Rhodanobacteraceae bacterium]|nr:tail fiber domain-containing protein [Rhodanobacteraceae bacterium]
FGTSGGLPAGGAWLGVKLRSAGQGAFVALDQRSAIGTDALTGGCPGSWTLDGNAGIPAGSYLGTSDAVDLVLMAGGITVGEFNATNGAVALGPFLGAGVDSSGLYSTSVGFSNGALGDYSFAGGFDGGTVNRGSFVWGDSTGGFITDSAPDQFIVQAGGGFGINTNAIGAAFDDLVLGARSGGDADSDLVFLSRGANQSGRIYVADSDGVMHISASGGVDIVNPVEIDGALDAKSLRVAGEASKATAGGFKANSDRRIKQDIEPVENAIDTILRLRPVTFRYTDAYLADHAAIADERYYNVVAQEFAGVFPDAVTGSGEYLEGAAKTPANEILQVDTYPALITTVAAVQELARTNEATDQRMHRLEAENAALRASLDRLSVRLERIENGREH